MAILVTDLTTSTVPGTGVFDLMMEAVKARLTEEFQAGRIKGPEYATVYLGALTATMNAAVDFLLRKDIADAERDKILAEITLLESQTALTDEQQANAVIQGTVLAAEECLLRARYDSEMENKLKIIAETALLNQRKVSEQAQTNGAGVDPESVLGKQITLYENQANGFLRDAEQKAADILTSTWVARRTTDEGTQANVTNKLDDATIGAAITKLLAGIQA